MGEVPKEIEPNQNFNDPQSNKLDLVIKELKEIKKLLKDVIKI